MPRSIMKVVSSERVVSIKVEGKDIYLFLWGKTEIQ